MKDKLKIIVPLVLVILLSVVALYFLLLHNKKSSSNLEINSQDDLVALINKVYEEQSKEDVSELETTPIDLVDQSMVNYVTGLENGDKLEYLVISEPLINARPYSCIIAKVKQGQDANAVAKELFDSINPSKWICVTAEKVYATSSGDVVFLIMTYDELAKPIYESFKKIASTVNEEYQKDGQNMDDLEFPEVPDL